MRGRLVETGGAMALGLLLGGAALLEGGIDPQGPGLTASTWLAALTVLAALPAAVVWPIAGLVLGSLPTVLAAVTGGPEGGIGGTQLIALLLLVGYATFRMRPRPGFAAYAATTALNGGAVAVLSASPWEGLFFPLILGAAYAFGVLLRRERARSAELAALSAALHAEREARARDAVLAERMRISRELHDAVAHSVSVMTLQAGVVRRRLPEGSPEHVMLESVEQLGRRSVDEVRQVVGLLREPVQPFDNGAQPSMACVEDLAAQIRAAGLPVRVQIEGDPVVLPEALDRSAYRIVQEALSNVVHHAGRATATVRVCYRATELLVEVLDDGTAAAGVPTGSPGGHGLVGMRERVAVFGGELEARPRPEGGFAVRASLPLAGSVR